MAYIMFLIAAILGAFCLWLALTELGFIEDRD